MWQKMVSNSNRLFSHCFLKTKNQQLEFLLSCLIISVDQPGLEPGTSRLWVCCSNRLSYKSGVCGLVVLPRFELGLREPKTLVLPLHHRTILGRSFFRMRLQVFRECSNSLFSNAAAKLLKDYELTNFLWRFFVLHDVFSLCNTLFVLYGRCVFGCESAW